MTIKTMRAWRSNTKGLAGLELGEAPCPEPKDGELLVRVDAAALNYADLLMIDDRYQVRPERPFVAGQELAGTVVAAGQGAGFAEGDQIASKVVYGGFADYAIVRADMAMRVPAGYSPEAAAALPIAYTTALIGLTECTTVSPADTVLVLAAAGGTGLAMVEVAKHCGAFVIAAAGGPDKCALTLEHGADVAIDYRRGALIDQVRAFTIGRGVNVVVDSVGGDSTLDALRLLSWGGRLLIVGFSSGTIPQLPANRLMLRRLSAIGVYWDNVHDRDAIVRTNERLSKIVASGEVRPHIGAVFPFDELPKALTALGDRGTTGKVILKVAPSTAG
ncbi:MAG: NADPH:quinone oxidoreductase family protein [Xanthobacteraceae bacterium]